MSRALITAALVACLVSACVALPFGKNSGVTELSPDTVGAFLKTHKPVFLMLYAPWCGHCKEMHPAFEKFAQSVKGVVKVGAINADEHKSLAQRYDLKGFPTIKYWGIGSKKGKSPQDYQGGRTAGPMQAAALGEVNTKKVSTVGSLGALRALVSKAEASKVVLLVSSKSRSPPMFSVLSYSPPFAPLQFAFATESVTEVKEHLHIEKVPAILTVHITASGGLKGTPYTGAIEYTAIAKHLQAMMLGGEATAGVGAAAEEGSEDANPPKGKPAPAKPPTPAAPVGPVELTEESWARLCSHGAPKVRGSQPMCVVLLRSDGVDAADLFERFSHEAVLVFRPAAEAEVADTFTAELAAAEPFGSDDILVVRAQKDRTRYAVWRSAEGSAVLRTDGMDSFEDFLGRCITGDTTFKRVDGFPSLAMK